MNTTTESTPAAAAAGAPRRGWAGRTVDRLGGGVVQIGLIIVGVFWLVPTLGLMVASFQPAKESATSGWWTALVRPAQLTLENYGSLLSKEGFGQSFVNTIAITVPATLLVIFIAAFAAYAFAWMEFPGRDVVFLLVIGLLVVPIQVALLPGVQVLSTIGLFETIPGVVLFHVAFGLPFAIFLLRNYFAGIPASLLEAARMDGAGEIKIFFRVVFPLGMPAIASLGIFQFLWVWNDMLVALVFAQKAETMPMTVWIQSQLRQFASNFDIMATGSFISLIIPLVVFFSFQRYFVQGVLAGSVK